MRFWAGFRRLLRLMLKSGAQIQGGNLFTILSESCQLAQNGRILLNSGRLIATGIGQAGNFYEKNVLHFTKP
jgi:hypothetical protein